jgi:hypothetical protein
MATPRPRRRVFDSRFVGFVGRRAEDNEVVETCLKTQKPPIRPYRIETFHYCEPGDLGIGKDARYFGSDGGFRVRASPDLP